MSQIGDYVHFRHTNYREFGIGRSSKRGLNFNNAYQLAKSELKKYANYANDFNADEELRQYLDLTSANSYYTEKDFSNEFKNLISEHFNNKAIDFEKKSFNSLAAEFEIVRQKYSTNNTRRYNIQTITRFKNAITNLYKKVIQTSELNPNEKEKLLNNLRLLGKEMKKLQKQESGNKLEGYKSIFKNFNELSQHISKPTTKEKGDLAEIISYYMLAKASGMAEKEVVSLIKKDLIDPSNAAGIVGAQGSKPQISFSGDLVDADELLNTFGKNAWQLSDGHNKKYKILTSITPKQNTVDIQLKWGEGEDIRASVKNYSSNTTQRFNIGLIKETPLTLLFNLINNDFVNHYLNIMSLQKKDVMLTGNVKKANEIIKKALVVRGLSGYRGTNFDPKKVANTFIFNDSASGKVTVINIGKLLNELLSLSNQGLDSYLQFDNIPDSFKNTYVGNMNQPSISGAKQRITGLLTEVHKTKLSMSLRPAVLQKYN